MSPDYIWFQLDGSMNTFCDLGKTIVPVVHWIWNINVQKQYITNIYLKLGHCDLYTVKRCPYFTKFITPYFLLLHPKNKIPLPKWKSSFHNYLSIIVIMWHFLHSRHITYTDTYTTLLKTCARVSQLSPIHFGVEGVSILFIIFYARN